MTKALTINELSNMGADLVSIFAQASNNRLFVVSISVKIDEVKSSIMHSRKGVTVA